MEGALIIGIYGREERRQRLLRFHEKRKRRIWNRDIVYKCRKDFAKKRPRGARGRFAAKAEPPSDSLKDGQEGTELDV